MRKILFTICLTLYCAFVNAQSMSVSSFILDESDLTANLQGTTVLDQNGEKCALIKIVTTAKGLTFDVGVLGVRKVDTSHFGEVWLYVPYGVRKMTINHQQYGQIRDYVLPENVERARTYVMKLKVEDGPNKTQMLTVMYKPQNAIVVIDNKIVRGSNGTVTAKLPVGSHQYQILADGYDTEEGVVNIKPTSPSKLIIELTRSDVAVEEVVQPQPQQQQPSRPQQQSQPKELLPITVNNVTFNMIYVEGGTFTMGATAEQGSDAEADERPARQVTLSPYYIGQTEVTQALWQQVMGRNPSKFKGENNPVERVSWNDCQKFITQLNQMTGKKFRMLTEAEWEYAARGGNKSSGYKYCGGNDLNNVAWYKENSDKTTHAVAAKQPNELDIFDMSGNVGEWCSDTYASKSGGAGTSLLGAVSGVSHIYRGGNWVSDAKFCRISRRDCFSASLRDIHLGLRLALSE